MIHVLHDKSLSTRFRILVELAKSQPSIQQKDVAVRLGVTPQAISQYIGKLVEDGWVVSEGRSKYRVTAEGVNWVLSMLRELTDYADMAQGAVTNLLVCTAVAGCDISRGQKVGLTMQDGVLVATSVVGDAARGVAVADAAEGGDVGVSSIEGIVKFNKGRVTILQVPNIQRGGSARVDIEQLTANVKGAALIGAVGIESLVALRKAGFSPQYFYGVREAVVEAARSGLLVTVACVEEDIPAMVQALSDGGLSYELLDLGRDKKTPR